MRALALILAIALLPAFSFDAFAQDGDASPRNLVLEVWLNGASRGLVVNVSERNGDLLVERSDLGAIGLKDADDGELRTELVAINRLSGVRVSVNEEKQQLLVTAAGARLAVTQLKLRGSTERQVVADTPVTAFAAEYDVIVTESDATSSLRKTSVEGALALSAFTPIGTFTTNGFAVSDPDGERALRLDTSWTLDDPPELRRLTVGDTISGGVGWSRSVRFGGVQLARDFSLQPELVTIPMPDFFGEAAVPGSVDVLVGASKVFSDDLPAGPFDIHDLPIVTGAGQATVVVRDPLGRETKQTINYFTDNQALAEGLTSYSVEAGFLRKSYGLRSFDYGDAMVSATLRHGLTDDITVEGHAEATENVAVLGLGGVIGLFDFGSLRLAGAGSTSELGDGAFGSASLSMQFGPANLFASFEGATPEFRDIASFDGQPPPRQTLQLGGGLGLEDYGSLSLSYLRVERQNDERTTLATATYSMSIGSVTFGITSVYDPERDSLLAETFLSVPLGGGGPFATAGLRAQDHDLEVRATLEQPASPDGGFGYRFQAVHGDATQFNADGRWEGSNLTLDGRLASVDGSLSAQLEASGAIVSTGETAFLTPKLDGAFALVDAGAPGVGIYRENRLVAESDESGVALLTGLVPFTRNHIAVDPGGYDMSRVLAKTDLDVVPGRGGAAISLAPSKENPVALTVTLPDGSYPEVGTTVHLSGDPNPWIVGYHGALFVADLKLPLQIELETKFGLCRLQLTEPPAPSPGEIPRLGPIACAFAE